MINLPFICSIKHRKEKDCGADSPAMGIPEEVKEEIKLNYTYSVKFTVSIELTITIMSCA